MNIERNGAMPNSSTAYAETHASRSDYELLAVCLTDDDRPCRHT